MAKANKTKKNTEPVKGTNQYLENNKAEAATWSSKSLLLAAFLEGAMVIAIELIGGKMLAAFYGSSLKIWTAVICVTITFLTLGYFLGGKLSGTKDLQKRIVQLFSVAAILMVLMPETSVYLFSGFSGGNLLGSTIFSVIILIGIPILLLGISSPIIIQLLNTEVSLSGWTAGRVYAISTVAGILFTLLTGFWFLPQWGISKPLMGMSLILILVAMLFEFKLSRMIYVGIYGLCLLKVAGQDRDLTGTNKYDTFLSIQEGIMGQLKVMDRTYPANYSKDKFRLLIINGIMQSGIYNDNAAISHWAYVHKMAATASMIKGGKALLFGMGGGSIATELSRLGYKTDVVDIDRRMFDISKEYFYFKDSTCTFTEDDARHYMRVCQKKYDLLVFDICSGEVQPSNVFTLEGMEEMKRLLKPDGMILVQYQEKIDPSAISGSNSIANTFLRKGFKIYRNIEPQEVSGIILLASRKEIDFKKMDVSHYREYKHQLPDLNIDEFIKNPYERIMTPFKNGVLLTDDRPVLENLNAETIKLWREIMIKEFSSHHLEEGKQFFK